MFCKIPMFTFGERLIDYLQAYECFLEALGLESSFMSFAVGRFCPTPEAADLIVLDFWDNLRKLNAKDKYFDATNDCLILTDLDAGKDRQTQITEFRDLFSQKFKHVWLDALLCMMRSCVSGMTGMPFIRTVGLRVRKTTFWTTSTSMVSGIRL